MAYKTLIFLAANLVYLVHASDTNDLCSCDTGETKLKEDSLLWEFMKKLSVEATPEDKNLYAVLPGELSPLIDCGCEEYNRKKRKAVESADDDTPPEVVDDEENTRAKKSLRNQGSCPEGQVKLFSVCVAEDALDLD